LIYFKQQNKLKNNNQRTGITNNLIQAPTKKQK